MVRSRILPVLLALSTLSPAYADDVATARGAYLAKAVLTCGNCHTPLGEGGPDQKRAFAGGRRYDGTGYVVYSSNLTPDVATGIGGWSDAELGAAITEGVARDGRRLAPIMPYATYRALLPEDLAAVIAYLRSLAPIENAVPSPEYRSAMPDEEPLPGYFGPPSADEMSKPEGRGHYLAGIARCLACHTTPTTGARPDGDPEAAVLGAGGAEFEGPWGVSVAANITSSRDAGLGTWSDAEIRRAVTEGIGRDGRKLKPPMPYRSYAGLAPEDLNDLLAFLRTLPQRD